VSDVLELGAMLRFLVDAGWQPALLAEAPGQTFVCFPQGEVRAYMACRAPDPLGAVRGLYEHALRFPNERPTFAAQPPSPLDQRAVVCEYPCAAYNNAQSCACVERGLRDAKPAPRPWYADIAAGYGD
jgi:hypothetical protein